MLLFVVKAGSVIDDANLDFMNIPLQSVYKESVLILNNYVSFERSSFLYTDLYNFLNIRFVRTFVALFFLSTILLSKQPFEV